MDPSNGGGSSSFANASTTNASSITPSATITAPASTLATAAATTACSLTTATATTSSSSNSSVAASAVSAGLGTVGNQTTTATVLAPIASPAAGAVGGALNLITSAATTTQTLQPLPVSDVSKGEDINNSSLASGISEGQRSVSAAPSASSSPILSPPGKIFGRNANGTMVATSRPSNEAETQLYRVLQRASLLVYYDTLLEMGGDDVQQLYEAGEEEFLEIMALVGMASKPLHVRRLQKALHEWANNPALFQGPLSSTSSTPGLFDTPTKSPALHMKPDVSPSFTRTAFPSFNPTSAFNPTPLAATSSHLITQMCQPVISVPVIQPHTPLPLPATVLPAAATPAAPPILSVSTGAGSTAGTTHHVSSSSPQLTPVLTEMQVARITQGAEKIARQLPQREPRAHTSKKRTSRELEQVIAMHENDPRRMDEIRKYSAIYGRFDCKRRPEKPLTLHEVCVNEAAAQLCRLVPALLTRRDELFPLARQIVKDAGFGHSASIARYGGLLPQVIQAQQAMARSVAVLDSESSDSMASASGKRARLASTETTTAMTPADLGLSRDSTTEDSRYNLFAMYQKFAKPPFDLTDISKFNLSKSEYDDNDNDSRLSFSNSSSPSMPLSSLDNERDLSDSMKFKSLSSFAANAITTTAVHSGQELLDSPNHTKSSPNHQQRNQAKLLGCPTTESTTVGMHNNSPLGGVQVISAAGGHIIAVANPALALSPTLNEALSLKREANSPEL